MQHGDNMSKNDMCNLQLVQIAFWKPQNWGSNLLGLFFANDS